MSRHLLEMLAVKVGLQHYDLRPADYESDSDLPSPLDLSGFAFLHRHQRHREALAAHDCHKFCHKHEA
jgi:hypothetical protein